MDHDRQDVSTPATRCAADIMPVAVSLSNAPPTATPSSVMGRFPSPQVGGGGRHVEGVPGSGWNRRLERQAGFELNDQVGDNHQDAVVAVAEVLNRFRHGFTEGDVAEYAEAFSGALADLMAKHWPEGTSK